MCGRPLTDRRATNAADHTTPLEFGRAKQPSTDGCQLFATTPKGAWTERIAAVLSARIGSPLFDQFVWLTFKRKPWREPETRPPFEPGVVDMPVTVAHTAEDVTPGRVCYNLTGSGDVARRLVEG